MGYNLLANQITHFMAREASIPCICCLDLFGWFVPPIPQYHLVIQPRNARDDLPEAPGLKNEGKEVPP
jgi:hypothetical protein